MVARDKISASDGREGEKGEGRPLAFLVVLLALLVLQGGYAPAVSSLGALLLCAIGLSGLARGRGSGACLPVLALLPALIPLLYLASSLVHGVSYASLEPGGRWALFAAAVGLSATMAPARRRWLLKALAWVGVASSALGLVMVDPAFAPLGWSNAGRLQHFFQYANTAGIWFACVAALAWFSQERDLAELTYLPMACLLLTQSGGSMLLFAAALVVMAVVGHRCRGTAALYSLVLQCVCATLVFFASEVRPFLGVMAAIGLGVALRLLGTRRGGRRGDMTMGRPGSLVLLAVLVILGAGLLCALVLSGRLAQASQTMIERLIQIMDGMRLALQNLPLGIGPDEWRSVYREAQSAQYVANAIHCGYAQLALDAGIVSLAALVVTAATALSGLVREVAPSAAGERRGEGGDRGDVPHAWGLLLVAALLLAHALIDIDFQFGVVLAVLGLVVGEGLAWPSMCVRLPAAPCLVVMALLGALFCWAGGARVSARAALDGAGDDRAVSEVAEDPLVANDLRCQTEVIEAYLRLGKPGLARDFAQSHGLPANGEQAVVLARCLYSLGSAESAESVLLDALEREPYFVELYEAAVELFDAQGASPEAVSRYNELVERACALANEAPAAWLSNQEEMAPYRPSGHM